MHAGVKSLLAGNQQAAVTVAVEGLMDAKANAEADSFVTFDPKVCWQQLQHVMQRETYQLSDCQQHVHVSHKGWQLPALCPVNSLQGISYTIRAWWLVPVLCFTDSVCCAGGIWES